MKTINQKYIQINESSLRMKCYIKALLIILLFASGCGEKEIPEIVDEVEEVEEEFEEIVCENEEIPLVGIVPEKCFTNTVLNEDFSVFRGERLKDFDLDNDGLVDFRLRIDNKNFGIASPGRYEAEIILLNDNFAVETKFLESSYCTRWLIPDPDATPVVLDYFIDRRLCDFYSEEELAACDTVTVEEFAEFMVQSYELNEEIPNEGDWMTGTVLIKNAPKQPGDFHHGSPSQYIIFRKEEADGSLKYGWLAITVIWDYWTTGTIESYGMMD